MRVTFTGAANRKMAERYISVQEVELVIASGRIIREYPDDRPFPSRLVLGWPHGRALHVVHAINGDERIVISTYEPNPAIWNDDFTEKRERS